MCTRFSVFIFLTLLSFLSKAQERLIPRDVSPIKMSREAIIQIDQSDNSEYAALFSLSKDSCFIFSYNSIDTCLLATEWGHSTYPIKHGQTYYTFSNFRDQTIVRKVYKGSYVDSILLDDQTDIAFSTLEGDLILIKEYPYLFQNDSCDEFVTIRKLNSNLELLWKAEYKNEFQNLSGALWTSRAACSNDFLLIVNPLTNVLSYISLVNGKRMPYQFQVSKDSWSFKMDSTYSTWSNDSYVPIKARLGEIMYSWQKMSIEHIESVYSIDSLFFILNTKDYQSNVCVLSPYFGELLNVSIDSSETSQLLGKRLNFIDFRATYLNRLIVRDTMFYEEKVIDIERYFLIPCYIEGDLFCRGCINSDFSGIIVLKSLSRVDDVVKRHKYSVLFPKAKLFFVEDTSSLGLRVNSLIYITLKDYLDIFRRSKKNVSSVH